MLTNIVKMKNIFTISTTSWYFHFYFKLWKRNYEKEIKRNKILKRGEKKEENIV